ncbi:MAG: class I SAM-dependent methyltransferase [Desulfobacterales bacterium]|jgi:ubiquinone/menaquinone biosynthesis C-methylase UbiE
MVGPSKSPNQKEIDRINRIQREHFDRLYHLFDPPLPAGVPERLEKIVMAAAIETGDSVLDVGTGTGILIPIIRQYEPGCTYACDLSEAMLRRLKENYSGVKTIQKDVRELTLPDESLNVVFINACYPNIADKAGALKNISRMLKPAGRMIISHPLGKAFIDSLRQGSPYPLDDFPLKSETKKLLGPYGFAVKEFVDRPELYILAAVKRL